MTNIGSHSGNQKLGSKISTFSRSYKITCPNHCEFLENGCYAKKIEKRFPSTKKHYRHNLLVKDWQKIRSFLITASKKGNDVRYHVSGDFMITTKNNRKVLDIKYINALIKANLSLKKDKIIPPKQFLFTHVYHPKVAALQKFIKVYASVKTYNDYIKAKKSGFKLFAWSTSLVQGRSNQKTYSPFANKLAVVCFYQLGTKKDCSTCRFCIEPSIKLDVAFMNH